MRRPIKDDGGPSSQEEGFFCTDPDAIARTASRSGLSSPNQSFTLTATENTQGPCSWPDRRGRPVMTLPRQRLSQQDSAHHDCFVPRSSPLVGCGSQRRSGPPYGVGRDAGTHATPRGARSHGLKQRTSGSSRKKRLWRGGASAGPRPPFPDALWPSSSRSSPAGVSRQPPRRPTLQDLPPVQRGHLPFRPTYTAPAWRQ